MSLVSRYLGAENRTSGLGFDGIASCVRIHEPQMLQGGRRAAKQLRALIQVQTSLCCLITMHEENSFALGWLLTYSIKASLTTVFCRRQSYWFNIFTGQLLNQTLIFPSFLLLSLSLLPSFLQQKTVLTLLDLVQSGSLLHLHPVPTSIPLSSSESGRRQSKRQKFCFEQKPRRAQVLLLFTRHRSLRLKPISKPQIPYLTPIQSVCIFTILSFSSSPRHRPEGSSVSLTVEIIIPNIFNQRVSPSRARRRSLPRTHRRSKRKSRRG